MMDSKDVLVVKLNDKKEYQRLIDGEQQSYGIKVGRVYLEPGQACGQHSTGDREEVLIFLYGQGTLVISDNQEYHVGFEKITYIPPKTIHNVTNTSNEPLIYIFCVTPIAES